MAENGKIITAKGTDDAEWPAGREETAKFARVLVGLPGGFCMTDLLVSAQRQLQTGNQPRATPADQLVACGLVEQESGYLHATPALRCAVALFDAPATGDGDA